MSKDYSNQPTPPWKSSGIGTVQSSNNSFPIPPRTNDLMSQKSSNYEWKKAGPNTSENYNTVGGNIQNGGSYGGGGGGYGGFGGGNQGFQTNNGYGVGGGNANYGNNNRSGLGFGSVGNNGGFKDNIVYNQNVRSTDSEANKVGNNNSHDRANHFGDHRNSNSNPQNQDSRRNSQSVPSKPPLRNPVKADDIELEKKALEMDVSQDFFAKIKPLSLMQVAADVALRYARQEYYIQVMGRKTCPEKPSGSGQYTCKTCYINFLTKEKLNTHNNSAQHKELDDFYRIKKEQARLIMEKRITGPTPAKLEMKPIAEAEIENSLKPTELELDVYILGIYESVMKPYWPVPKSTYYCRMCNYLEFSTEGDFRHHNNTNDHKKREATYEEAFCLYCQRHYNDKVQLDTHMTTTKHIQIKNLMERTKDAAMEQWHKANNLTRSGEKLDTVKANDTTDDTSTAKAGSKRSAEDDQIKSPAKKPSAAKSDSTKKDDSKRSESEKIDSRSSDKKSSSVKSDSKTGSGKVDAKGTSKTDSRPSASSSKTDTRSSSKSADSKGSKSLDKIQMWFVPVTGTMCIVCHDLLKNEDEQKSHAVLPRHLENVKKFKTMIAE